MPLSLDRQYVTDFLTDRASVDDRVAEAHRRVIGGTTESPDMLGWRRMLLAPDDALLESVSETAAEIRNRADVLLCIGIGGSYLGAEAVMQALIPPFANGGPEVLFAGHHMVLVISPVSAKTLRSLTKMGTWKGPYVKITRSSGQ